MAGAHFLTGILPELAQKFAVLIELNIKWGQVLNLDFSLADPCFCLLLAPV